MITTHTLAPTSFSSSRHTYSEMGMTKLNNETNLHQNITKWNPVRNVIVTKKKKKRKNNTLNNKHISLNVLYTSLACYHNIGMLSRCQNSMREFKREEGLNELHHLHPGAPKYWINYGVQRQHSYYHVLNTDETQVRNKVNRTSIINNNTCKKYIRGLSVKIQWPEYSRSWAVEITGSGSNAACNKQKCKEKSEKIVQAALNAGKFMGCLHKYNYYYMKQVITRGVRRTSCWLSTSFESLKICAINNDQHHHELH